MIYANLGRRGTGKTTLAMHLVSQPQIVKRIIFDPRAQFKLIGARYAHTKDEVREAFDALHEDDDINMIVVVPDRGLQACFDATCQEIRDYVAKNPQKSLAFLVDELRFVDTRTEDFDYLLRCVPQETVHIVLTAHRPSDVPTDIRAIADYWCVFRTVQEHDIKVLNERCSPSFAEIVQTLEPRQFACWDDTEGKMRVQRDPSRWFTSITGTAAAEAKARITIEAESIPDGGRKLF